MGERTAARVIVPAYHAMRTLPACLDALARSRLEGVAPEVVVVDDGGNPGLDCLARDRHVDVIRSLSGSAASARNAGADGFIEGVLIFVDADVVVKRDALAELVKPLFDRQAVASVGNYSLDTDGLPFPSKYKQLYIASTYARRCGPIRNDFWTALGAIDAATFHSVGGFSTAFVGAGGEDTDLGIRLTEAGCTILGVPAAAGKHLHILSARGLIGNDWRKGSAALKSHSENRVPLNHNSHAGAGKMAAAATSVAVLVAACCCPVIGFLPLLSALLVYGLCHRRLIGLFARQGPLFFVRAFSLLAMLDLVRSACVAVFVAGSVAPTYRSFRNRARATC